MPQDTRHIKLEQAMYHLIFLLFAILAFPYPISARPLPSPSTTGIAPQRQLGTNLNRRASPSPNPTSATGDDIPPQIEIAAVLKPVTKTKMATRTRIMTHMHTRTRTRTETETETETMVSTRTVSADMARSTEEPEDEEDCSEVDPNSVDDVSGAKQPEDDDGGVKDSKNDANPGGVPSVIAAAAAAGVPPNDDKNGRTYRILFSSPTNQAHYALSALLTPSQSVNAPDVQSPSSPVKAQEDQGPQPQSPMNVLGLITITRTVTSIVTSPPAAATVMDASATLDSSIPSTLSVPSPDSAPTFVGAVSLPVSSITVAESKTKVKVQDLPPVITMTRTVTAMALPTFSSSSSASPSSSNTDVKIDSNSGTPSTTSNSTPTSESTSASSTSGTSPGNTNAQATPKKSKKSPSGGPIVASYYPDWTSDILPPEDVDFERLDWIDYAFAIPNSKFDLEFTQDKSEDILKKLVGLAHDKEKYVKLSIGGWTGSGIFSEAVATDQSRSTFVKNIASLYDKFNLDGIDIDWEYPGTEGAPGNAFTSSDSSHFLQFLNQLRTALPKDAIITAATQVWPFAGKNGEPMADVSAFAKVIDWVLLMNYDVWGSSAKPGPNAPLTDACHNSTQPLANAQAAIQSWHDAGFPLDQITLGVPAYGYISKSSASTLSQRRRRAIDISESNPMSNNTDPMYNDAGPMNNDAGPMNNNDTAGSPGFSGVHTSGSRSPSHFIRPMFTSRSSVTVQNDSGGTDNGQIQFRDIVKQGALQVQNGNWVGANGFQRLWDDCSSTPFLRSEAAGQIITYDDPKSLEMKGQLAKQAKILGINMWDAHGDTTDWQLIDAVRKGLLGE